MTGQLWLVLAAVCWSLAGIFTKHTDWNGACLAALRGVIAFGVTAYLLKGRRIRLAGNRVLAAFCYFIQGVLLMTAYKFTTAANATVLQNLSPLYIILLNYLIYRKRPSRLEWGVCGLLIAGIVLACAGSMSGGGMTGNAIALLSGLFYAGVFFLSKERDADPLESLFLGNAFYLFLVPYCLLNETVRSTGAAEWCFLVLFAFVTGILAWLFFTRGIKTTSALTANLITMLEPVLSPVWTFLILHETVSPLSLAGCALVILTLVFYQAAEHRRSGAGPA